jgi:hypothetical protein
MSICDLVKNMNKVKKTPNDIIYTPLDLAKEIIDLCDLKEGDTVLDPFRGKNAFYDQYPDFVTKDWCEIEDGRDFFDYDEKVDWIISNPPFSKMTPIIEHACKIANKGICLIGTSMGQTPHRHEIFVKNGFNMTLNEPIYSVKNWNGFRNVVFIYEKNKPSILNLKKLRY